MNLPPNKFVENIRANLAAIEAQLPTDPVIVTAFAATLRGESRPAWPQDGGIERGVRLIRLAGIVTVIWSAAATAIRLNQTVMLPLDQLLAFLPFDCRPEEVEAAHDVHQQAVSMVQLAVRPAHGGTQ